MLCENMIRARGSSNDSPTIGERRRLAVEWFNHHQPTAFVGTCRRDGCDIAGEAIFRQSQRPVLVYSNYGLLREDRDPDGRISHGGFVRSLELSSRPEVDRLDWPAKSHHKNESVGFE